VVVHWNVHSLRARLDALTDLVEELHPALISVNETWLWEGAQEDEDDAAVLPDYNLFTSSEPRTQQGQRRRAGVALYVHQRLLARPVHAIPGCLLTLEVNHPGSPPLYITSLYLTPSTSPHFNAYELQACLEECPMPDPTTPHLIVGDLNCHLCLDGREPAHGRGEQILHWALDHDLHLLQPPQGSFSYTNGRSQTLVDYALTSAHLALQDATVRFSDRLVSDHLPMIVDGLDLLLPPLPPATTLQGPLLPPLKIPRNPSPAQLATLSVQLRSLEDWMLAQHRPQTQAEMDALAAALTAKLADSIKDAFPAPRRRSPKTPAHLTWDRQIADAVKTRKMAYDLWKTAINNAAATAPDLFTLFKDARAHAKLLVREAKQQQKEDRAKQLLDSGVSLKTLLQGRLKRARPQPDPTAFSQHLEKIMCPQAPPLPQLQQLQQPQSVLSLLRPHLETEQLTKLVDRLPRGKARDSSGLSNEILALGGDPLLTVVQRLFILVADTGFVPAGWKDARVVPVPKTKTMSTDPTDFRPISVLPVLRRLYEKVLMQVIHHPIAKATSPLQFGFKEKSSTLDAALLLDTSVALERGMLNIILLDVKQAFDTAPHQLVVRQAGRAVGNNKALAAHLHQLLPSRVLVPGATSSFTSSRGTPQGSSLSPDLYSTYIDPTLRALSSHLYGTATSAPSAIFFADDQCLLAPTTTASRQQLRLCANQAVQHDYAYNATKSVVLPGAPNPRAQRNGNPYARHHSFSPLQEGDLALNQQPLTFSTSALYLGIPIQAGVGIDGRALALKNALSAQRASSALHYLRKDQGIRSIPILRQTYITYTRPCMFYGAQVADWTLAKIKPLVLLENRCLRDILDAPTSTATAAIAYLLRIVPVAEQAAYLTARYAHRLLGLPDDHPLKRACQEAHLAVASTAKTLISHAMASQPPKRIKDDPAWWSDFCQRSNSQAAKSLLSICPPDKAHHKLLLAIEGCPGQALRLWLLHRTDREERCNPDPKDLPANLLPVLQAIHSRIHPANPVFVLNRKVRLPTGTTLNSIDLLIRDVLTTSVTKRDHLHDIGRVLHVWGRA